MPTACWLRYSKSVNKKRQIHLRVFVGFYHPEHSAGGFRRLAHQIACVVHTSLHAAAYFFPSRSCQACYLCMFREKDGKGCNTSDYRKYGRLISRLGFLQLPSHMLYEMRLAASRSATFFRNHLENMKPSSTNNRRGLAYLLFSRIARCLVGYTHVAFQTPF